MKPFTESMRYEYDLTPSSVVFDCGGYEGIFAKEIKKRYACRVVVFEPMNRFYSKLKADGLEVYPVGIGGSTRSENFKVKGDMTGLYADGVEYETVKILAIATASDLWPEVELIKLNIEGMEFEVMEAILDGWFAKRFKNIQVQPHPVVPDCEARWQRIHERLLQTHELVYHAPWCWSGYRLK